MIGKTSKWAALTLFCPDVMEMKVFDIAFDETVAAEVIKAEKEFWERVQSGNPPEFVVEENNTLHYHETRLCHLCGFRHQCTTDVKEYTAESKEKEELNEEGLQARKYYETL
jgi:hypothetical protein